MPRPQKGEVREYVRKDGVRSFSLRFTADGRRRVVPLGSELEGWSRRRAELELQNTLEKVRTGIWRPPERAAEPDAEPSFWVFSSRWLKRRRHELAEKTHKKYGWLLSRHLLPFFADYRPSEITIALVDGYREQKLLEREEILEARRAGAVLRDADGRRPRPISNETINLSIRVLAMVLEDAVERGWLESNPAAGKRRRLKVKRRRQTWLEADELEELIEAAGELDGERHRRGTLERANEVRALRARGATWKAIAAKLGIAVGTAVYCGGLEESGCAPGVGMRRAVVATLGCAGLRASEGCALDWADADFAHRKIRVRDSKSEKGMRDVNMTPRLLDELLAYRAGFDGAPDGPMFPTGSGGRHSANSLNRRIVARAARRASERREQRGLPALPERTTPHALRRTYITLMFEAGASPPYVMDQVGHEDASTTLEIYARVLKRRERGRLGEAFDRLMRDAVPAPEGDLLAAASGGR